MMLVYVESPFAYQANRHIITSYYIPFPYLFITLLNMIQRGIIMLEETNSTVCWMFLQMQSVAPPSAFGVKFHKCAQVHQHDCFSTAHFIFHFSIPTYSAGPIFKLQILKTIQRFILFLLNHVVPRWSLTQIPHSWHSSCWFTTWAQWVAPTCLRWLSGTPPLE